jgi:hypothetical protein
MLEHRCALVAETPLHMAVPPHEAGTGEQQRRQGRERHQ